MSTNHSIIWSFSKLMAQVEGKVICTSTPDEVCRTKPARGCECEVFYGIDRDDQGWYHVVWADEFREEIVAKHRHVPSDECNIALWMNEDPMVTIGETYAGDNNGFAIGRTEIIPTWNGDEYQWKTR